MGRTLLKIKNLGKGVIAGSKFDLGVGMDGCAMECGCNPTCTQGDDPPGPKGNYLMTVSTLKMSKSKWVGK